MAIKEIKFQGKIYKISYEIKNSNLDDYILILHGWGAKKELMIKAFEKHFNNIKQIYIDLPGFGGSNIHTPLDTKKYANIVAEFIKVMPKEPRIIMGHSFGGKVATLLKPKYLVLLSTAGIVEKKPISVKLKIQTFKTLKKLGFGNLYKLFASKDVDGMDRVMYETLKNVVDEDFKETFRGLHSKTLIFWGKDDKAVTLKSGELINQLIKGSEFFPLNGDHFFFLLHAEFIAKIVSDKFIVSDGVEVSINETLKLDTKFEPAFDKNDEYCEVGEVVEKDVNFDKKLDEILNLKDDREKNIIDELKKDSVLTEIYINKEENLEEVDTKIVNDKKQDDGFITEEKDQEQNTDTKQDDNQDNDSEKKVIEIKFVAEDELDENQNKVTFDEYSDVGEVFEREYKIENSQINLDDDKTLESSDAKNNEKSLFQDEKDKQENSIFNDESTNLNENINDIEENIFENMFKTQAADKKEENSTNGGSKDTKDFEEKNSSIEDKETEKSLEKDENKDSIKETENKNFLENQENGHLKEEQEKANEQEGTEKNKPKSKNKVIRFSDIYMKRLQKSLKKLDKEEN